MYKYAYRIKSTVNKLEIKTFKQLITQLLNSCKDRICWKRDSPQKCMNSNPNTNNKDTP